MTNPSAVPSRYTTTSHLPADISRTASSSPAPPRQDAISVLNGFQHFHAEPGQLAVLFRDVRPPLVSQADRHARSGFRRLHHSTSGHLASAPA